MIYCFLTRIAFRIKLNVTMADYDKDDDKVENTRDQFPTPLPPANHPTPGWSTDGDRQFLSVTRWSPPKVENFEVDLVHTLLPF